MALASAAAVLGMTMALAVAARGQESAARATVWGKVYTVDQATRGMDAYMTECSACHSEDLGGSGYAPGLKGDEFSSAWNDKTVGDFFERIRNVMPPDNPGSLTPEKYRDIITFVLQENKYPAGDRELGADLAALRQITITGQQP